MIRYCILLLSHYTEPNCQVKSNPTSANLYKSLIINTYHTGYMYRLRSIEVLALRRHNSLRYVFKYCIYKA